MLSRLLHSAYQSSARKLNGRGIALWQRGDLQSAERVLRTALRRDPGHAGAAGNLGMVLAAQGRMDAAVAMLRSAVATDPQHAGACINLAVILHQGGAIPEAVALLRQALDIEPGNRTAHANLIKPLMDLCDWPAVAVEVERVRHERAAGVADWADAIAPFESLLLPFTPQIQLEIARHHAAAYAAAADMDAPVMQRAVNSADGRRRLRIAYLSADFHDHATAHLSVGLYAAHDRSQFDVTGYSIGHGDGDEYRRRIEAGCDRFVDATGLSAQALARRIAADGIDILVDMKGYTGGSRPDVLARRPAPLQVSFLGYPGSMGADFIDYLVADRVVIPEGAERGYGEKPVFMPDSYQVNDGAQRIAATTPERAAHGLPARGFVFCCFNQPYKIEPEIFAAWLRILEAVPDSVLWLQAGHFVAERRLRAAAADAGVDPARLVFAPYVPKAEHLARHVHADVFLDTHVVNAHTTASDALWARVPLLTWPGETFASRVAASLLNAIGLPDCVMPSLAAYEERAIELARQPERFAELKARLVANRSTHPLFNTGDYVDALERAYRRMWVRHCAGASPDSFGVDKD